MTIQQLKTEFEKNYPYYELKKLMTKNVGYFTAGGFKIHFFLIKDKNNIYAVVQITEEQNNVFRTYKYTPICDFSDNIYLWLKTLKTILNERL